MRYFRPCLFTKPNQMRRILLTSSLLFSLSTYAQNLKDYVFPDGIMKTTFNYTKSDGTRDESFKMVYEYLVGEERATVFVSNFHDNNVLSRRKEEYYITDTAIYLINTNTKSILSFESENYMGYNNCFLRLPAKGRSISWVYKETKETSYKCTAIMTTLTISNVLFFAIKVDKTPFENGRYLNNYKTSVYYVKGKGLYKEVPVSGKKALYILSSTENKSNKSVEVINASENKDDYRFQHVEVGAEFPGGEKKYLSFLYNNLRMPNAAEDNSINGTVTVSFVVKEDGSIYKIKVEKGLGYGCDEEAIRFVKSFPKWTPAKDKGKNVASIKRLLINFRNTKRNDNKILFDSIPNKKNDLIDLTEIPGIFKVVSSIDFKSNEMIDVDKPKFFVWGQKEIYFIENRRIEKKWQIVKELSSESDIDYKAKTDDGEIYIYPKYRYISITDLKGKKIEFRWEEILLEDLDIDPKYLKQ